jgi:hypothetical protein
MFTGNLFTPKKPEYTVYKESGNPDPFRLFPKASDSYLPKPLYHID